MNVRMWWRRKWWVQKQQLCVNSCIVYPTYNCWGIFYLLKEVR